MDLAHCTKLYIINRLICYVLTELLTKEQRICTPEEEGVGM